MHGVKFMKSPINFFSSRIFKIGINPGLSAEKFRIQNSE